MPQIILVEKTVIIPATPARVYKSLTDAQLLSRWLADRVESDPHQGGQIVIDYDTHEKRGEYKRLIPGVEVGIVWSQFDALLPIDLTGFKLDKVAQGTRVHVVDFARPDEADALLALWTARLKRLKKLYPAKPAPKKPASRKPTAKRAVKRKTIATVKAKPVKRQTVSTKTKKK